MKILQKTKVEAADNNDEVTIDDRIKQVNDDFSYVLDGLSQLDFTSANEILVDIENSVKSYIQKVAEKLS